MKKLVSLLVVLIATAYFNPQVRAQSIQKIPDGNRITKNADLSNWAMNISESLPNEEIGMSDYASEIYISGNTIHTLWLSDSAYSVRHVYYRRSTDNGDSWEKKELIFRDEFNNILADETYKRMAVDGNNVYIAIPGYAGSWHGILSFIKSTDGGATFSDPEIIATEPDAYHLYNSRIVATNGKLYIAFRNQCNWCINNSCTIKISSDGGNTFVDRNAYSITEGGGGWGLNDFVVDGNDIHVVYQYSYYSYGLQESRLYIATSHDDGLNFNSQKISMPSSNGTDKTFSAYDYHRKPKIVTEGNNVFVIWSGLNDQDVQSIFVRRSTDQGDTWEQSINLTTELGGVALQSGQETIAAKGNYVYAVFLTTNSDVYLKRSLDNGATFEPLQEITAPNSCDYVSSGWWPLVKIDPQSTTGSKVYIFMTTPKYTVSMDGGQTFKGAVLLGPYFSWREARLPQFDIDLNGNLHYVVEGYWTWYSTGVFGDKDILYQRVPPAAEAPSQDNYALQLFTESNQGDGTGNERMDNMQISASDDLNFTSAMTIEAWINVDRNENEDCYFIYKAEDGADGSWGSYMLGQWQNGTIDARIATSDGGFVLTGGESIPNNTWVHVAMTYDANAGENNLKTYLNGNLTSEMTATGNLKTGKGLVFVGGNDYYRYENSIVIDELRFWNIALSEEEIQANINKTLSGNETGLTAYYNFNQTTKDITGHGNDGHFMYNESFTSYVPTDIEEQETVLHKKFELSQNYPNPFNPTTIIKYEVPNMTNVRLILYNSIGQKIKTLVNEYHSPGYYSYTFDGSSMSSGVYFYQIIANDFVDTKKMILIK